MRNYDVLAMSVQNSLVRPPELVGVDPGLARPPLDFPELSTLEGMKLGAENVRFVGARMFEIQRLIVIGGVAAWPFSTAESKWQRTTTFDLKQFGHPIESTISAKEAAMSNLEKKLSDAIPHRTLGSDGESSHGKPVPDLATNAEQARESQEAREAIDSGMASIRDRMVAIGRGNQQSGRQGQ